MFQLIISILAIILAVALAGVSVYYGGSAFSNGSESAQFATLTNQGSQLEAGATLFRAQKGYELKSLDGVTKANLLADQKITMPTAFVGPVSLTSADSVSDVFEILVATDYLKQVPSGNWKLDATNNVLYQEGISQSICEANDDAILSTAATPAKLADTTEALIRAKTAGVSGCVDVIDSVTTGNVFFYAL